MMNPGCQVDFEVQGGFPSGFLGEDRVELLRVVREALTNVRRHSDAESLGLA
jgi:signal transduction histidine kinase